MADLDRTSHLPLSHQIATVLRYRIATGLVGAGTVLPSYRAGALKWGVNLHTVRRAYLELEKATLVRIDDRRGAIVLNYQGPPATDALDRFAREMLRAAEQQFGASGKDVIESLRRQFEAQVIRPPVWVVECSWSLSRSLADQVRTAWAVDARAWLATRASEVPAGTLVSTYFHFDELRRLLPARVDDLAVIHIRPALALIDALRLRLAELQTPRILLLDSEAAFAHGIVPELRHCLGGQVDIVARSPRAAPEAFGSRRSRDLILVSPRDWDRLAPKIRARPNVYQFAYDVDQNDLARIARRHGWSRAGEVTEGRPSSSDHTVTARPR